MKRILTLFVAAALAATALTACGGDDKKTVKVPGGGSVTVDKDGAEDGNLTITDEKGNKSSFGSGTEVPDDFPKADVPLPDDAKLSGVVASENEGEKTWVLTFETSGSVADVAKTYRTTLEGAGFTFQTFQSMGSGSDVTVVATGTSDKWRVNITGGNHDGKSSLMVTVSPPTDDGLPG